MKFFPFSIVVLVTIVLLSGCITPSPNSIPNSSAIKNIGEQNASIQTHIPDGLKSVVEANNQLTSNLSVNISEDDDLIGKIKEKNVSIQTHNPDGLKNVVEANNQFASNLYVNISKNNDFIGKNIFFSPFSISSALAPVYEGSRGTTADEIKRVLGLPSDDTLRRNGYSTLFDIIKHRESNRNLYATNAIWAEKTYPFLPQYEQIVQEFYQANVTNLDFIHKSEGSRVTINQWVLNQTNNAISNLIPAGGINPLTRLVITNAIFFKGIWKDRFKAVETTDEDFLTSLESSVRVRMMHKISHFNYVENNNLQILEVPYTHGSEGEISMIILLPKSNNLTELERTIQSMNLSGIRGKFHNQRVKVDLPKFKLETEYHLPKTLSLMGMPRVFSDSADLSGMDGSQNLFVNDVIHKAYVEVDEEGTEAAAATAAVSQGIYNREEIPSPLPLFRADHPFIFLIHDTGTDTILFMGRIENPTGAVPESIKDRPVELTPFQTNPNLPSRDPDPQHMSGSEEFTPFFPS